MAKQQNLPVLYVGIGASAGGLEAIEAFFSGMSVDSGMAFIVIQHLSPDHKSMMKEILSKKTSMQVNRAENSMEVLPDNIYLIPPKQNLTIFHGKLYLTPHEMFKGGINLPIDIFLRSLAEDQADKAVSIILSGSGSDGMRGVRAVKENGGMVMVQEESSARFDSMPRAAISTGLVDYVLPPDEMPGRLLSYAKHPYVTKQKGPDVLLTDENALSRIFALLQNKFKVDFSHYKPSTLTRRIQRRMTINRISDIKEYVACLESYPAEASTLFREFLIGVTRFFRDRESFEALQNNWLPDLIRQGGGREMRFWCAACSTGEEAYSLAILVRECAEKLNIQGNFKVFATDIHRESVQSAAAGIFPESMAADVPDGLLKKYFYKRHDRFQITREIREMVVFAQHNLIKDPPFTNIDLITCRNLLIYLQPQLQQQVLDYFNFSLNINGILFLGNSESIGDMGDYFQPLDHKNKIFITRGRIKSRLASDDLHKASQSLSNRTPIRQSFGKRHHPDPHEDEEILERFLEVLKTDRIHLAVIVNHNMEILHTTGPVSDYFSLPSGRVSMDISKMTSRDLAIPLSTGIQKVIRENESVNFSNIQIQLHGESKKIHMRIMPLPRKKGQQALVAVFLDPVQQRQPAQPQEEASYDLSREAEQRISDLEQELQFTRENLQATVEELETANEELQATNEELLAGNEELQSTNEELQSTNEELYSVNSEYQSKIIELTELHNDVGNLLSSSQIGTLLLDENLEIRRFSPKVTEIFKLLDTDLGRPITHIAHYIQGLDPVEIITRVQETHKESENQIQSRTGRWYLMRVVPYEVGPEVFSGTVISFVDITRLKHFQEELARSRVLLDQTQKISRTGGWELDVKTGKITWTDEVYNIFGVDKNFDPSNIEQDMQFYDPSDLPRLKKAFDLALKEGRPYDLELPFTKADGTKIWIRTSGWPVQENGRVVRIYGNIMDITDMKDVQQTLRMSEQYYRNLFTEMPAAFSLHEVILDDSGTPCDYRFLEVNPAFEQMTGLKSDQVIGRRVLEILPDTESYWIRRFGKVALEGGHAEFEDYSGALDRYFRVRAFCPEKNHFAVIFQDVTQEKVTCRELETCREKIAELEKLTGQES